MSVPFRRAPAPARSLSSPAAPPVTTINEHAHGDDHPASLDENPVTAAVKIPVKRLLPSGSADRKRFPMCSGLLDYFPDALAAVAEISFFGNEKHNPGEPLHWARGKSMDHADCAMRHLVERGGFDGDMRHTACLAWRALAMLQEELEAAAELSPPRNARDAAGA